LGFRRGLASTAALLLSGAARSEDDVGDETAADGVHFYGKLAAGRHEARGEAGDWQIR